MSAGILTLTNNYDAVTTFTTELAAGDFIVTTVGGITYTLPDGSTFTGPLPRPWQSNLRAIAYQSGSNTRISVNSEAGSSSGISGLGFTNGHGNVVVARVGDYD